MNDLPDSGRCKQFLGRNCVVNADLCCIHSKGYFDFIDCISEKICAALRYFCVYSLKDAGTNLDSV
jgi:hypothetical protein